jgi:hypothetical protein
VLVADLSDELLDDVLEGDDARGPAVLVDDDHHLQSGGAQLQEQRVEPDGLGDDHRRDHEGADGDLRPAVVRHGDGLLDVDEPIDVVPVVADDGEPGVTGMPGQPDHVVRSGRPFDAGTVDPRGHDVGGSPVAEVQGAGEHPRGTGLEGALLGGPPDQAGQLLRGASPGQLLLRGDAHRSKCGVRRAVEDRDERPRKDREGADRPGDHLGRGQWRADAEELRHELAEHHREQRDEDQRERRGHRARGGVREPERDERAVEKAADRRFGEVPDDQRREGDADLRCRQLGGQLPQGPQDRGRALVPVVDGLLHGGPVERDERELRRDEQSSARGEGHGREHEQPLGHSRSILRRAAHPPGAAAYGRLPAYAASAWGMTLSAP